MQVIDQSIFIQTQKPPLDNYKLLIDFFDKIFELKPMVNSLGILVDDHFHNIVFFLITDDLIEAAFRINLSENEVKQFLVYTSNKNLVLNSRALQGININKDDLGSLVLLQERWNQSQAQNAVLTENDLQDFLERIYNYRIEDSRGANLNTESSRKVIRDSHGRCMFTGCGQRLNIDEITGIEGNYGVQAHNVASSENSTRGIPYFSHRLSADPQNILMLCEKHHRLIDKVAGAEYSASTLSAMRQNFISQCEELLDALSYEPMQTYVILWPVNKNVPHQPSRLDVANSLRPLRARLNRDIELVVNTSNTIREASTERFYEELLEELENEVNYIVRTTQRHSAAIFAFGPMPALIALGARLGNKAKFVPMLMYRDGSCWMWPKPECEQEFFTIDNPNIKEAAEISIRINLTADVKTSQDFAENLGYPVINISAKPDFMGNGAIRNPNAGIGFSATLHKLFHTLKNQGVSKIHLFPCASNAACVWIGQAYDVNHPELTIYDFADKIMKPRINFQNINQRTNIILSTNSE